MRLALGIAVPDHVSRTVGTPPPITSPRWIEPDESLEPGEYLVGGSTSTNLSRGRILGYGLYFTNRRVIGIKRRGIGRIILTAAVVLTTTALIFQPIVLHDPFLSFASFPLTAIADPVSKYLTRKVGEGFLSRSDKDKSRQVGRKRKLKVWREDSF